MIDSAAKEDCRYALYTSSTAEKPYEPLVSLFGKDNDIDAQVYTLLLLNQMIQVASSQARRRRFYDAIDKAGLAEALMDISDIEDEELREQLLLYQRERGVVVPKTWLEVHSHV